MALKHVYIIGAYRAPTPWGVELNIREAEKLAFEVWSIGVVPICPHTMGRFTDKTFEDEFLLEAGVSLLTKCDAAITVPKNLHTSSGAYREIKWAQSHCIPVFHDIISLGKWVKNE